MSAEDLGPMLDEAHERFKDDPDYVLECLYNEIVVQILDRLDEKDMTQADLARRMDVSPARVSQILGGPKNFGLKTLAKVAAALNLSVDFELDRATAPLLPEQKRREALARRRSEHAEARKPRIFLPDETTPTWNPDKELEDTGESDPVSFAA